MNYQSCFVTPHFRRAHHVRGHFRNTRWGRVWINAYLRNGSFVNARCQ